MRLPCVLKVLTAGLIALSDASAFADQLSDVKKKGEIVFGTLGIDESNSSVDPQMREFVGYVIDLARAVARDLGVKAVFTQVAVAAHIPELLLASCTLSACRRCSTTPNTPPTFRLR